MATGARPQARLPTPEEAVGANDCLGGSVLHSSVRAASKLLKRGRQLRRLGAGGIARTGYITAFGKATYRVTDPLLELKRRMHRRRVLSHGLDARVAALTERLGKEMDAAAAPLIRDIDPKLAAYLSKNATARRDEVLGEFDQDGDLLLREDLRAAASLPGTDQAAFTRRTKYGLQLVCVGDRLGVRKQFGEARGRLVQELEALLDLRARGCAVPAVIAVDWDRNALTTAYVRGRVVREILAAAGAAVRDSGRNGEQASLSEHDRIRSAREFLDDVLSRDQVAAIADELLAIHRAGYVVEDVKYGNIILREPGGSPLFVDFERALPIDGLAPRLAAYLRDVDRRKLNDRFGTDLPTAAALRSLKEPPGALGSGGEEGQFAGVYAPAVVRDDIHWGPLWNTDVGIGRWNFIMKEHLPIPKGGTILDLGANNGFNALQMLRSGAASAVGVELDPGAIQQGEFLKRAFEWADNRVYDFSYIRGSHSNLPSYGLGRFDLVTALCTLYYVPEDEMRSTVGFLRTISDLVVLQCNTDRLIDRTRERTFEKASVEFSVELLKGAGFRRTEVIAPANYSRPLVIGRAS